MAPLPRHTHPETKNWCLVHKHKQQPEPFLLQTEAAERWPSCLLGRMSMSRCSAGSLWVSPHQPVAFSPWATAESKSVVSMRMLFSFKSFQAGFYFNNKTPHKLFMVIKSFFPPGQKARMILVWPKNTVFCFFFLLFESAVQILKPIGLLWINCKIVMR